jgi:hypothetical protein
MKLQANRLPVSFTGRSLPRQRLVKAYLARLRVDVDTFTDCVTVLSGLSSPMNWEQRSCCVQLLQRVQIIVRSLENLLADLSSSSSSSEEYRRLREALVRMQGRVTVLGSRVRESRRGLDA